MKTVSVYTDGSADNNGTRNGGWAAIFIYGDHEKELVGNAKDTNSQRMELTAVVEALKELREPCRVELHTDSFYVIHGIQTWLDAWLEHDWHNSQGDVVKNIDLWEEIIPLREYHHIQCVYVKGHSRDKYNDRCDRLANEQRNKVK